MDEIPSGALEVISEISPSAISGLDTLIFWIKAVGVAFIIYLLYTAFMAYFNYSKMKKLRVLEKKIFEIDKKVDKIYRTLSKKK